MPPLPITQTKTGGEQRKHDHVNGQHQRVVTRPLRQQHFSTRRDGERNQAASPLAREPLMRLPGIAARMRQRLAKQAIGFHTSTSAITMNSATSVSLLNSTATPNSVTSPSPMHHALTSGR